MVKPSKFSFSERVKSIGYGFQGIIEFLRNEHNARVHLFLTILALCLGSYLNISKMDWFLLTIPITLVWVAEAFNTAIEYLCDTINTDFHPLIKTTKDIAAGAVLISVIVAIGIGLIVLIPYVVK